MLHERPIADTSIPHPWVDRRNGVLGHKRGESVEITNDWMEAALERPMTCGCGTEARAYHPPPPRQTRTRAFPRGRLVHAHFSIPNPISIPQSTQPACEIAPLLLSPSHSQLSHTKALAASCNKTPPHLMRTDLLSTSSSKCICSLHGPSIAAPRRSLAGRAESSSLIVDRM